jgi:hypothetical protein
LRQVNSALVLLAKTCFQFQFFSGEVLKTIERSIPLMPQREGATAAGLPGELKIKVEVYGPTW